MESARNSYFTRTGGRLQTAAWQALWYFRQVKGIAGRASLFDFCHAALGGKLLELQHVVTGYDALEGTCQLDHPGLFLMFAGWSDSENVALALCSARFR